MLVCRQKFGKTSAEIGALFGPPEKLPRCNAPAAQNCWQDARQDYETSRLLDEIRR